MTKKDTIYVDSKNKINHKLSGYILRLPKLMKIGAVVKNGRLDYTLVDEDLIDKKYVTVIHDHSATAKKVNLSKLTKKQLIEMLLA